LSACLPLSVALAGEYRYTRYNIHYQDKGRIRASYANWTDPGAGHGVLPPNTEVMLEDSSYKVLEMKLKDGRKVEFEFHADRMKMKAPDYFTLITSPTPVSLDGLSDLDKKEVKEGKALPGMSKKGVMTALGYPAVHFTPTLEASEWFFWKDRFGKLKVSFDDQGIVKEVTR